MAIITAAATASIGYFLYQALRDQPRASFLDPAPGPGLHRSNAIRRRRRSTLENDGERRDSTDAEYTSPEESPAGGAPVDWPASPPPLQANTTVPRAPEEQVTESGWETAQDDPAQLLPASQRAGQNIVSLLFRVSEDNARRNAYVHRGCACNVCNVVPIRGIRYRCANCADFDLCETCESQGLHIKTHIFYKIKVPAPPFGPRQMQPVWYPGDPDSCPRSLPRSVMARLSRETGFERPELEAFWEQWTFMANTEWRDDPDELGLAMDRRTFEQCLVPSGAYRHAAPSLIHERMFSFYDTNNDDLIGFSEFLRGLSYRKRKDKLRRVFDGYDMDKDGFVSRRDFLRIFRAYYVLYKQMHRDIMDGLDDQVLSSTEAHQLITSRQPLSSLFGREGRIPQADSDRPMEGKVFHSNGDVVISDGKLSVINGDKDDSQARDQLLYSMFQRNEGSGLFAEDIFSPASEAPRTPNGETDTRYLNGLLNPPTTVQGLQPLLAGQPSTTDLVLGDSMFQAENEGEQPGVDGQAPNAEADESSLSSLENQENREDLLSPTTAARNSPAEQRVPSNTPAFAEDFRTGIPAPTFANALPNINLRGVDAAMRESSRRYATERRSRVEARRKLFDRWRRRQFYLDEEEGALPPDDWNDDEDVLVRLEGFGESSKAPMHQPLSPRSRSSSKVRFAEDTDDYDATSNVSTSSRSIPERWGGMEIPDAERDTGREILYQVTQQAFNELLDILFKKKEDQAIEASKTKQLREKYREQIETVTKEELEGKEDDTAELGNENRGAPQDQWIPAGTRSGAERTLTELLDEAGYTVDPQAIQPVDDRGAEHPAATDSSPSVRADVQKIEEAVSPAALANAEGENVKEDTNDPSLGSTPEFSRALDDEDIDPTLPQFRPNTTLYATPGPKFTLTADESSGSSAPLDPEQTPTKAPITAQAPKKTASTANSRAQLVAWKKLDLAEEEAKLRGGWGKLSYDEFEKICRAEEDQRNRLDYLGSWIDFCIP
jgi:Ca2+-binding EF-hand superfamily protein